MSRAVAKGVAMLANKIKKKWDGGRVTILGEGGNGVTFIDSRNDQSHVSASVAKGVAVVTYKMG